MYYRVLRTTYPRYVARGNPTSIHVSGHLEKEGSTARLCDGERPGSVLAALSTLSPARVASVSLTSQSSKERGGGGGRVDRYETKTLATPPPLWCHHNCWPLPLRLPMGGGGSLSPPHVQGNTLSARLAEKGDREKRRRKSVNLPAEREG